MLNTISLLSDVEYKCSQFGYVHADCDSSEKRQKLFTKMHFFPTSSSNNAIEYFMLDKSSSVEYVSMCDS